MGRTTKSFPTKSLSRFHRGTAAAGNVWEPPLWWECQFRPPPNPVQPPGGRTPPVMTDAAGGTPHPPTQTNSRVIHQVLPTVRHFLYFSFLLLRSPRTNLSFSTFFLSWLGGGKYWDLAALRVFLLLASPTFLFTTMNLQPPPCVTSAAGLLIKRSVRSTVFCYSGSTEKTPKLRRNFVSLC